MHGAFDDSELRDKVAWMWGALAVGCKGKHPKARSSSQSDSNQDTR